MCPHTTTSHLTKMDTHLTRKCNFILKVVLWCVIFIVNLGITLPGVIIAVQYQYDTCVTKTSFWNLFLDNWLLCGSIFHMVLPFLALPCVCHHFKTCVFQTFLMICDVILLGLLILGIFLAMRSDLRTCEHDSLWVMSMIFMVIIGIHLVLQTVYVIVQLINSYCVTREFRYEHISQWTGASTPNQRSRLAPPIENYRPPSPIEIDIDETLLYHTTTIDHTTITTTTTTN